MAVTFSRTLRALRSDRLPWGWAGLLSLWIVPAALAWMVFAEVTVYEVSSSARLEVEALPQSVVAEVEGRVTESHLHVGLETAVGDVLVVLNEEAVRRSMAEREAHMAAVGTSRSALLKEIQAQEQSLAAQAKARELGVEESRQELAAAEARARFAQRSLERAERLANKGAVAEEERDRLRTEVETTQKLVQAAQVAVERRQQDRLADETQRQVDLEGLHSKVADLEGELAIDQARLKSIEHDLEMRQVRAHVAGRVEEVNPLRVGAVVRPGEKLATIVPPGDARIVAYLPVVAVGRIQVGQPARLRLDGFPWTQYGTLSATVTGVGNESSDGQIRVELGVIPDPASRIPLQHGQTGSVEIAVEYASPAVLVLRAAGEYLMTHRPSPGS